MALLPSAMGFRRDKYVSTYHLPRSVPVARAFGVGAIIVIAAIVSRQVYLRSATEAGMAGADEDPAGMMLIRCETMNARLQNRHSSIDAADADEPLRVRCRES